ncbi:FG-GAP-like repeat-containing protein, partial [Planctomycetota bacterium]
RCSHRHRDPDFFSRRSGGLEWHENLGGTRGYRAPEAIAIDEAGIHRITPGDFDGDGDDDFFLFGIDDNDERVSLLLESVDGDDPFGIHKLPLSFDRYVPKVTSGDLNDDGDDELIVQGDSTRIYDISVGVATQLAELPQTLALGLIDFEGNTLWAVGGH